MTHHPFRASLGPLPRHFGQRTGGAALGVGGPPLDAAGGSDVQSFPFLLEESFASLLKNQPIGPKETAGRNQSPQPFRHRATSFPEARHSGCIVRVS
eukprot:scaffold1954_cov268-Pinguiococcus_pyrenoidosus.AAC.107